jgi:hypothetical protein
LKERSGHVENCNQKLGVLLREEKHADFLGSFSFKKEYGGGKTTKQAR